MRALRLTGTIGLWIVHGLAVAALFVAGIAKFGNVFMRGEILRRNQIAAIEFSARRRIVEHVVFATRLRARAAVGAPLGNHPGHEALSRIRDAQRAMHE